ncbi:HupE/UreJ family protein [Nitratireductor basaltis]|nr:HupE/UreJ family protein [Nitratireductor basaltis]
MKRLLSVIVGTMVLPAEAMAHPPFSISLIDGLLHPISGVHHLLAMIAVGVWAAQSGGRAVWAWPVCFIIIMVGGSAAASAGFSIPFVEPGILTSILVLGLMITFAAKLHIAAGAALIAVFALLHGYVHGVAYPIDGTIMQYLAGLILGTACLHAAGIAVAGFSRHIAAPWATQALGALTVLAGFGLLFTHA